MSKGRPLGTFRDPKYYRYDNGCYLSPTCLDCNMPECKEVDRGKVLRTMTQAKHEKDIVELRKQGVTIREMAVRLNLNVRTVNRLIADIKRRKKVV